MFKELRKFAVSTGCKDIKGNIKKDGLTEAQRDEAVKQGIDYFRTNRANFAVNEKDLRSAVHGMQAIAKVNDGPLPSTQMADVLSSIAPWVEMRILTSCASTYAYLFHQGQTNKSWSADRQAAAKEACEFFKI